MLLDFENLNCKERFQILNLVTVLYRLNRGDMIEMCKFIAEKYDKFKLNEYITRGQRYKVGKLRPRLDILKLNFTYKVVNNFNSLLAVL